MIGTDGERESRKSMQAAGLDDDMRGLRMDRSLSTAGDNLRHYETSSHLRPTPFILNHWYYAWAPKTHT